MNKRFRFAVVVFVICVFASSGTSSTFAQVSPSSMILNLKSVFDTSLPFNGWMATGSAGFAKANSSVEIDLPSTSSFTIEGWFKLAASDFFFFKKENDGEGISFSRTCSYIYPFPCTAVAWFYSGITGIGHPIGSSLWSGWNHLAVVNDVAGGETRIYVNGTLLTTFDENLSLAGGTNLLIGCYISNNCVSRPLAVDEFRISDVIRYETYFTPATLPFTCDDTTRALWHFDELEGSNIFHDSCGSEDNFLMGINDAHAEGIPAHWIYIPMVIR